MSEPRSTLPAVRALAGAARAAAAKGEPLVVMATMAGCAWCEIVRRQHLGPLWRAGQVHAVELDIQDRSGVVVDFAGRSTSPHALSQHWGTRVAPTVLFFGPDGQELAERLVGVGLPDFYGEYLDARLRSARLRLRGG